jgi:transposase
MSTENQTKQTVAPKKQITTELLKELMLGGMNRKAIAEHLGASVSVINKLFKHPELASIRPKHASEFELVDSEGKTYSPGYLANAAKEAKEAEAQEAETEQTEAIAEGLEGTAEVAEETTPVVAESTGI